jgi:hypothetical protein
VRRRERRGGGGSGGGGGGGARATTSRAASSSSRDYDPADEVKYRALFAIVARLYAEEQQQQQQQEKEQATATTTAAAGEPPPLPPPSRLAAFAQAQPAALGVPFLCWLADLEAASSSSSAPNLAALCERLVVLRERGEREAGERLYRDTLRALGRGDAAQTALVASDPRAYQAALSVALTGVAPPGLEDEGDDLEEQEEDQEQEENGSSLLVSPAPPQQQSAAALTPSSRLSYGRLMRAAPPAALTPAGVAAGLAAADELATEARQRQRSSLAAVAGRAPLTAEAEAALIGGTAASRILDLLLSFGTAGERLALLPDCFTPPPPQVVEGDGGGGGGGGGGGAEAEEQQQQEQETEELWCTPLQLLLEVESRLRAATDAAGGSSSSSSAGVGVFGGPGVVSGAVAGGGGGGGGRHEIGSGIIGSGEQEVEALEGLRAAIRSSWLETL